VAESRLGRHEKWLQHLDSLPGSFWPWLAGVVDRRSQIGIAKQRRPDLPFGFHFQPVFDFTCRGGQIMDHMAGSLKVGSVRGDVKIGYTYRLRTAGKLLEVLMRIQEHLVVKHRECEVMIEYLATQTRASHEPMTQERFDEYQGYYVELKALGAVHAKSVMSKDENI